MLHRPGLGATLLVVLPIAFGWTVDPTPASEDPASEMPFKYTGPGSCSAPLCHGAVAPQKEARIRQDEVSVWVRDDRHSRAYEVLREPLAVRMAKALGLPDAVSADRCLDCHALNVPAERRAGTFEIETGVGCEGCHGPAASWLGPHTTRGFTHEQSLELGMVDTRDAVLRVERCLGCHVGDAERSVDHALIAAGHPDLVFELDTFSDRMPPHWRLPEPARRLRDLCVAQAVQLAAALDRLSRRAGSGAWPEYAELQCDACHHGLTSPEASWRQGRERREGRPGDAPWNPSTLFVWLHLARLVDSAHVSGLEARFALLSDTVGSREVDPDELSRQAVELASAVRETVPRLQQVAWDGGRALDLLRALSGDADRAAAHGAQSAEQTAMAVDSLLAIYTAERSPSNASALRGAVAELFATLDDLSQYDPRAFSSAMRRIDAQLP